MTDIVELVAQANARGPTTGMTDNTADDLIELPSSIDRETAKIFTPLKVGSLLLQHRVIHAALGRSRSANAIESPLAAEYFVQRTTPGALIISQATGVAAEWAAWPWAVSLESEDQRNAAARTIQAVHERGGYWFQQLFHILAGNGFLLDQFLHDNINQRVDEYGGSLENRSRFLIEVVDSVAEVVGYERIGVRLSPFSNFHETDGSQPLDQVLHASRQLALRGIAYLHIAEGRVSRNLDIEENLRRLLRKGIKPEDISLRPFRRLLSETRPNDPSLTPTVLIGNGGYNAVTSILTVEQDLADAVSFGRHFISNPDLVTRLRFGYPFAKYDRNTFYTHGAEGYTTYPTYRPENNAGPTVPEPYADPSASESVDTDTRGPHADVDGRKKRVAIVGAGVSGIVSAAALERIGCFDIKIFERRDVPGGSWVYDACPSTVPVFPATDPDAVNPPLLKPKCTLPAILPRDTTQRFETTPLYSSLQTNIPYKVMAGEGVFVLPPPKDESSPFLSGEEVSKAVINKAHEFDHLIHYKSTLEDVEKLASGRLRLTIRRGNPDDTDTWYEEEFDHLIVATGHNSVPRVPDIPGLSIWKGSLVHTVTWRSGEDFKGQSILIVGSSESAIDVCLQSLPHATGPIFLSQRTPHPRYPTVFARPGVEVVSTISHLTDDTIHLTDGRALSNVDTIVFATGYFYTYPFLSPKIRPPPVDGLRVPGLYQHIFDIHNPDSIAFVGVVNASLTWSTWEKSAFLVGLLWSGKIRLPPRDEQEAWERRRLAETSDRMFHILQYPHERVLFWDELNQLAAEYLQTPADDKLLRGFPFEWMTELMLSVVSKMRFYGIDQHVPGTGSVGVLPDNVGAVQDL
ncbi:hypothetical protein BDW75DRAFT_245984 [Aspergillus navahoensis]